MEPAQIILPVVATFALGTALLVPLRDDRRGRRATLGGAAVPLRPQFGMRPSGRGDGESIDETLATNARESIDAPRAPVPSGETHHGSPDESHVRIATGEDATEVKRETPFSWLVRTGVRVLGIGVPRPTAVAEADVARSADEAMVRETLVERSFASELATLLGAATDRECDASAELDVTRSNDHREAERDARVRADEPAVDDASDERSIDDSAYALVATSSLLLPSTISLEPVAIIAQATSDASQVGVAPPLPIVARALVPHERVVPITRLPLRPHGLAITWTRGLPLFERETSGAFDAEERRAILERLQREPGEVSCDTIERAYHEEEGPGRVLALRVLARHHARAARAVFVDALHTGTDDERALAVDGLAAGDARDALPAAFSDRVEAIAARAALEYVGFADRATYRTALSPFIEAARLDALLALLAGIAE